MITENLSTLKIHKLTQVQYDRELAAGNIDANALYLTPDEEIDLSPYATVEQLNAKADTDHNHSASNITSGTLSSDILPTVPITKGGTNATSDRAARQNLHVPFSTGLYAIDNKASFKIVGEPNSSRRTVVKVAMCSQYGTMCEIMFAIVTTTGSPVGTNFVRWGNLGVSSLIYSTTDNTTTYTITFPKGSMYAFGTITFTTQLSGNSGHDGEAAHAIDAYQYMTHLTEGTTLTEAALV